MSKQKKYSTAIAILFLGAIALNTNSAAIASTLTSNTTPQSERQGSEYLISQRCEYWEVTASSVYMRANNSKTAKIIDTLERIIPDIRDRIVLELIGTPLTHTYYLRRHHGTYGSAIVAGKVMFPGTHAPIPRLYRVGDSTMPGIGVPAVAASGILCANTLVTPQETAKLLDS